MDCGGYEPPAQVIFPACHMRATASGVSGCLAEFRLDPGGYRVGQRVLTLTGGVQVDQRGAAGGVAHALHQLTKIRLRLGNQAVAGMAQVMSDGCLRPMRPGPGARSGGGSCHAAAACLSGL